MNEPNNVDKLANTLATLNAQLEVVEVVDPDTRALLNDVRQDIEFVLQRSDAAQPEVPERLPVRLSKAIVRLEGKRPKLVASLRRISEIVDGIGF